MDLNYSPIIRSGGTVGGVFAIVTETTDMVAAQEGRRQAERDLLDEQERLRSLFEQAPALIAVVSGPNHVFKMANPLYLRTLAPNRDIIGKPLLEAMPELKSQSVIEILDTVLKTGKAYVGEISVKIDRYDNGILEDAYFNLVYQPTSTQKGGTPDGIFVHAVEITDQVQSRQQAEQLSAELAAIFDSLPDGVFTTNMTHVTHVNQRGAELLGYSSPQDVPADLTEFYQRLLVRYGQGGKITSVQLANTGIGKALAGETTNNVGVRLVNPTTGAKRTIRSAAAPIRDPNGKVIGAVATTTDMTAQYELQERIQKETVRRRVLTQKAKLLKVQNEQLTALNETKDEFIALTSHQLRTPATGVKQYVGMVIEGFAGDLSDKQKDFLDRAYDSNERQLHIIDDILRVARIDLDQIKLNTTKQDLGDFIRNLVAEQSKTFANRHQMVALKLPEKSICTTIDARNLGMAIGNIIDNASKYTADGKSVTIALDRQENQAVLTIKDEGVGIDEKDLGKLFQKFSRIPNERSIQVGGTGLGLYLAQRFIQKHRGTIDVSSKPGNGTTFTITLPIA
jgi:signal transduction histidine kinase